MTHLQSTMNEDLALLEKWMHQHKLTVNASKTKYMLFNVPKGSSLHICYGNNTIELVDAYKYLGVWLDSEMKWTEHITRLTSKLAQVAGLFRKMSNYIPERTKRSLYFSMFHSHLVYGIAVWGTANSTTMKPLQTIQNKAIKNLFGFPPRTSTLQIHNTCNLLLVDQVYKTVASTHIHKILTGCIHTTIDLSRRGDNHQHNTRHRNLLAISRMNTTTFGRNSALNKAISTYNILPENLKQMNVTIFKKHLKTILLSQQQ